MRISADLGGRAFRDLALKLRTYRADPALRSRQADRGKLRGVVRRYDRFVEMPSLSLRVAAVSLDCRDHNELARFYVDLLAGTLLWAHDESAAVESGEVVLVMQRIEGYQTPTWPGTSIIHLDLNGDAPVDELERRAIALGARTAQTQPDPRWRVLLDPAGHPFCITPFTP